METLQALQKRITTTGKLQSIVKSMKTLSAVSVRQYERSVASLDNYLATIELALQVAMRDYPLPISGKTKQQPRKMGLVVFGSDQGLCGRFNENLAAFLEEKVKGWGVQRSELHLLAIGARMTARLEANAFNIDQAFWVPGSVNGINHNIYHILSVLEQWREDHQLTHIEIFFNRHAHGTAGEPYSITLLPIDNMHLQKIARKKWQGRSLPQYRITSRALFSGLIRQYLFVSLFRAQAESLESEQASRLRSMQNAEKNIEEHIEELQGQYSAKRQSTITSELLDLVAGFRAAAGKKDQAAQQFDASLQDYFNTLKTMEHE